MIRFNSNQINMKYCLSAAISGAIFFDDPEIHMLTGINRRDIRLILNKVERGESLTLDNISDIVCIIGNIIYYPHGKDHEVSKRIPIKRSEIERLYDILFEVVKVK